MPLYKLHKDMTVSKVSRKEFKDEAELHKFVEKNAAEMLGMKLIASEYTIPNGRIDSLGLDEAGVPVIIEYKWKKDMGAIIQGLSYLNWVVTNKKPFEAVVKDTLGKDASVNWSTQPRVIILAQDFDPKELSAITFMGPSVELKKYSLYEGLFSIADVNITKPTKSKSEQIEESTEKYSIEQLLSKTSTDVQQLFSSLREEILGISSGIWEKVGIRYVDYRTSSTFASVNVQKERLKIYLKTGDQKLKDPKGKSQSIPKSWGYGLLNRQFFIHKMGEVSYAMSLIKQAHDYVTG